MALGKVNIIIGDSWGVSEWDKDCNLSGPGIGQYLMLHSEVINLSVGAGSNTMALDRLESLLSRFQINDDRIFWIVTDPCRCVDMDYFLKSPESISQTVHKILNGTLDRANKIADKHQIKIELIGGICDLRKFNLDPWPGLVLSVPSWGELIDPDYHCVMIDPDWWKEFGTALKSTKSNRLAEWIDISDDLIKRNIFWKKYFKTDGSHPDRKGHKILRDYLFPEWAHKY